MLDNQEVKQRLQLCHARQLYKDVLDGILMLNMLDGLLTLNMLDNFKGQEELENTFIMNRVDKHFVFYALDILIHKGIFKTQSQCSKNDY